jgi:hypothetical protein
VTDGAGADGWASGSDPVDPLFVRDCLDALREGRAPMADLDDDLAALELVVSRAARTTQAVEQG